MSNVQITKQLKNATTDKLNLNLPLIHKEVSMIFRWLQVIRSLPLLDDFKLSENQATKKWKQVFTPPPGKHKLVNMRWLFPLSPWPCLGWGGGFKWLVHYIRITIQNSCSGDWLFLVKKADEWTLILWLLVRVRTIKDLSTQFFAISVWLKCNCLLTTTKRGAS